MNRGDDRDDWFEGAEPDGSQPPSRREDERSDEDWLLEDGAPPPRPWLEAIDRRVLVVAIVGVVFLIAVLAAAGVFSGSSGVSVPAVTSTSTVTASTTEPTTTPSVQAVPAPTAPLKPGDTGAQVKVLQRALASLGFAAGKTDGQYGAATKTAVERFQRSAGLTADGIVGPATLTALATALRGP